MAIRSRARVVLLSAFILAAAAACVRYVASPAPDAPLAPLFDERAVHGVMDDIGVRIYAVELILREGTPTPQQREEVLRILEEIEHLASRLSAESLRASHPLLANNLDAFVADVRMARRMAAAEPPNYFLAGTISGACSACHGTSASLSKERSAAR